MKYIFLTILTISLFATIASAQSKAPVSAVSSVDLDQYVGQWYEIAKYPNRFQKKCISGTIAVYKKKADGRIEVVNSCIEKSGSRTTAVGDAKIIDTRSNAKLKVRFAPSFLSFLPLVWGDYWIIDLGKNYEYAVVGTPGRDYLWILSRTREIDAATYQGIIDRIKAQGFEPNRLVKTPQ